MLNTKLEILNMGIQQSIMCKTNPIILDSCSFGLVRDSFHRNDGVGVKSESGNFLCYQYSFLATNKATRSAIMSIKCENVWAEAYERCSVEAVLAAVWPSDISIFGVKSMKWQI